MSQLYDTFLAELEDIYDAEKQLVKALAKMADAAKHEELKEAFREHLEETEEHVRRVEKIFDVLGEKAATRKSKSMQSLITECTELIEEDFGDAALVCAAQKIEHYEIASYGCLRSWAQFLDMDDPANLLEETLDEENAADEHLTSLAVQVINLDGEDGEGEDNDAAVDSDARSTSGPANRSQ
ncbi:MAG TPA: ferritin-like domain-containing protein [Verrucomicrobiae bacterium]|jgi:ferritin-like metal-binding protein YciE